MNNHSHQSSSKDYIHLEKRFGDFKAYSIGASVGASLIISALVILFAFNFNSEKENIRILSQELKKEISDVLGKTEKKPEVIFCDITGSDIENKTIKGNIDTSDIKNGIQYMNIIFYVKNIGNVGSGKIWFKYYANDPLVIGPRELFDESFKYSLIMTPEQHSLGYLPGGGFSVKYIRKLPIFKKNYVPNNIYPILIRIYNDGGLINEIKFRVKTTI